MQKLKRLFDSGKDHNLLAMDGIDPNDIATLLKLYLRERKSFSDSTKLDCSIVQALFADY